MPSTLTELETEINADLNGEAIAPTEGNDDWNYYKLLINRYQREWAEDKNWNSLRTKYLFSTTSGQPTYSLPSLFKKPAGFTFVDDPTVGRLTFSQIKPEEAPHNATGSYKYFITGEDVNGYVLNLKFAPNGDGTGSIEYFKYPLNLASPTDRTIVQKPRWLIEKSKAGVWEKDEDPRFVNAEAKADELMANMLTEEEILGYEYHNKVMTQDDLEGVVGWGDK